MNGEKHAKENVSLYPAFAFKATGLVEKSKENSNVEEDALCSALVEKYASQNPVIKDAVSWYSFNTATTSVLQGFRRPMCGLAALCMAAQMLGDTEPSTPQHGIAEVFEAAKTMGFTKQGEMFSAHDLAELAAKLYGCSADVIGGSLIGNRPTILEHLRQKHPVLVAYDNDRNFEPCLRRGHRAHWTLLTGAVIGSRMRIKKMDVETLPGLENVFKVKSWSCLDSLIEDEDGIVYVYAKQGKSAKHRLWSLRSLSESNSNLLERDITKNWEELYCPHELSETLRDKFVVLHF